ncbi:MAG: hypothetical protein KA028_01590 [Candidatus Pacebacteria bacterium]|nr:hypothetical protein [Candidatus Paceibacterota bacterium]
MRKMIENLKKQPAHVRDQVAVFAALGFTAVVAFFWLASLSNIYAAPETKTSFKESFSPFNLFGASVRSALDRSKEELSAIDPANAGKKSPDDASVTVDQDGVVNLGAQTEDDVVDTNEQ